MDKCVPVRTLKRECRPGCKYQRGQWMPECRGKWRFRFDTLIGPVSTASNGAPTGTSFNLTRHTCAQQRRVMKDCKRVCRYSRSVWSQCNQAGFKSRNLTLDYGENSCKKQIYDRRKC